MIDSLFAPKLIRRGLRSLEELAAGKPHGTRLRYMAGCKCFSCRRSNSDYERQRQAARAAGDWNGIVDAGRAAQHLRFLSRRGIGRRAVQAVTDISDSILHEIAKGRRPRIRARTERKILAVTLDLRADHSFVPARRTWKLIGQLLDEGYTKAHLARELGAQTPALQISKGRVLACTEQAVITLHRRLTT